MSGNLIRSPLDIDRIAELEAKVKEWAGQCGIAGRERDDLKAEVETAHATLIEAAALFASDDREGVRLLLCDINARSRISVIVDALKAEVERLRACDCDADSCCCRCDVNQIDTLRTRCEALEGTLEYIAAAADDKEGYPTWLRKYALRALLPASDEPAPQGARDE